MMQRAILAAVLVGGFAAAAQAQTLRHVEVGFGVGKALPVGTDSSGGQALYVGTARFDLLPHLALDAELGHGGSSHDYSSGPGRFTAATSNASITTGQYQSARTHYGDSTWVSAFSFVAHTNGRVAVFGGGGPGFAWWHSDYDVSYVGCSAPAQPSLCKGSSYPEDGSSFTLHLVGGADARITNRVAGFVSVAGQAADVGGPTYVRALVGVRLRVR